MRANNPVSSIADERSRFYNRIADTHLTPLWEVLDALVPPHPRPTIVPALWRFADVRNYVLEAGSLITAKEAERRVLILENPAATGQSRITQSLYAGLQLILPGEVAPAHRHAQSALRLLLEGEGAYTAVDGERTTMHRGDFIITPSRTWHDHGNLGSSPVIWLDGLDIPLVQFLDAGFAEKSAHESQANLRIEGDTLARYGHNLVPVDYDPRPTEVTRLFVYPFTQTRDALIGISRTEANPHWGHKLRFVNPANGRSPMATIGAYAQHLPKGFESKRYRSTDSTIYVCLDGEAQVSIDSQSYHFSENDIFVAPSWSIVQWSAPRSCILFSFSDRPVQQALGLWRDEKLAS